MVRANAPKGGFTRRTICFSRRYALGKVRNACAPSSLCVQKAPSENDLSCHVSTRHVAGLGLDPREPIEFAGWSALVCKPASQEQLDGRSDTQTPEWRHCSSVAVAARGPGLGSKASASNLWQGRRAPDMQGSARASRDRQVRAPRVSTSTHQVMCASQ